MQVSPSLTRPHFANQLVPLLASNRLLGDALAICGSILYGISNVAEEHVVKSGSTVEFLGMLGLGGAVISGIQM